MFPEIVVTHEASMMLRSYTLHEGYTTFGRYTGSQICLDDPTVSRDHGAFLLRSGVLVVVDHQSSNGIFMDGLRTKRRVLYEGDRLTVGPFEIYVKQGTVPSQDLAA
ncbi:FHA domain-containing protein [Comamonas koreensis]|uniref:FHA domain-containing protein n=1 Tax=Comamonas koreensis TaxID=160825 RepID=UPI0038B32990